MFVRLGLRSSRCSVAVNGGGVLQLAQQLQGWRPGAAFSTTSKREALDRAQREAADTRALHVSAAQTAVGIAVVGAIAVSRPAILTIIHSCTLTFLTQLCRVQ